MTPEELLKPRYKMVEDYPDAGKANYVGKIYTLDNKEQEEYFNKYPAIFKPLQWWEDRAAEDMPEYVKWNYMPNVDDKKMDGYVQKVLGWSQAGYGVVTEGNTVTASKNWLPSTESEYLQSVKSTIQQIK